MFQRYIETSAFVQGYGMDDGNVYLLSDNRVQVFDASTREKVAETRLFEKDGLARSFHMDDRYLYCTDFVQLYVLDRRSLDLLARTQLGTDLSSDICGGAVDESYLYLGIRNGPVARIRKGAWEDIQYFPLSTSSIWVLRCDGARIYAGNVEGQLLVIDPAPMEVVQQVQAHRQNLKSLCLSGNLIATASQDKALALWARDTLASVAMKRAAHKKAFAIAGIWNGSIVTVSYACGEIKVWDLATLGETAIFPIARCLSGQAMIRQSHLYLSSRAIQGIDRVDLRDGDCHQGKKRDHDG